MLNNSHCIFCKSENLFYILLLKIQYLIITVVLTFLSCKEITKETVSSEKMMPKEDYIFSTLISKNGEIVFEEYYNGKTKNSLCDVQSLTKGLMSILIGIAIDKEYIKNVNEPIEKYFPNEFKNLTDNKKNTITIKHLLNHTAGLPKYFWVAEHKWKKKEPPSNSKMMSLLATSNVLRFFKPGRNFDYSNTGYLVLASIVP